MKHLKHYYGSNTVREIIPCVCVCVTNTKGLQKGLNNKSVLCMLTTYFYCLFLSVVRQNFSRF